MSEQDALQYLNRTLTSHAIVKNAVANDDATVVTLAMGCSFKKAIAALNTMSAGGQQANRNCARPKERQAVSQVGGYQGGKIIEKYPEFTDNPQNTLKWARRGGWLVVKIRAKYLVLGDVGQSGWVCLHSAPLEWGSFIEHDRPVAMNIPNAD